MNLCRIPQILIEHADLFIEFGVIRRLPYLLQRHAR